MNSSVESINSELIVELSKLLKFHPTSASNVPGVQNALSYVQTQLQELGFKVDRLKNPGSGADVLVSWRKGSGTRAVGLFGHVDVELCPDDTLPWVSGDPWSPTIVNDRLFCRGVGDNLGPSLLRLLALRRVFSTEEGRRSCPPLFWVIHGEEEIGSPFAHAIYPKLADLYPEELGSVVLWMEETGYFLADGSQRILLCHKNADAQLAEGILGSIVSQAGDRRVEVHDRYLNKAFGQDRCPCLTHLIDGKAIYLAVGPNDVNTNIHERDESIPLSTIDLSAIQFIEILKLF